MTWIQLKPVAGQSDTPAAVALQSRPRRLLNVYYAADRYIRRMGVQALHSSAAADTLRGLWALKATSAGVSGTAITTVFAGTAGATNAAPLVMRLIGSALVLVPLASVEGLQPALDLLFAETDRVRCGSRLLADRLFGEVRRFHPLVGFGHWAAAVERGVRRFSDQRGAGVLAWALAVLPWVTYLALPVSVHPLLILLPSAALLGLAMLVWVPRYFGRYRDQ